MRGASSTDAKTAQGKKPSGKAWLALNHIKKLLSDRDADLKIKTDWERLLIRLEKDHYRLLEQLKQWLIKCWATGAAKNRKLVRAIKLLLKSMGKADRYQPHGHLNIDNNRAEESDLSTLWLVEIMFTTHYET